MGEKFGKVLAWQTMGCLKMRCPFSPLNLMISITKKRAPHFATYPNNKQPPFHRCSTLTPSSLWQLALIKDNETKKILFWILDNPKIVAQKHSAVGARCSLMVSKRFSTSPLVTHSEALGLTTFDRCWVHENDQQLLWIMISHVKSSKQEADFLWRTMFLKVVSKVLLNKQSWPELLAK